jgi:hypothetical protein
MHQFQPVHIRALKFDRHNAHIWGFRGSGLLSILLLAIKKNNTLFYKEQETNEKLITGERVKQKKQFYYYTQTFNISTNLLIYAIFSQRI